VTDGPSAAGASDRGTSASAPFPNRFALPEARLFRRSIFVPAQDDNPYDRSASIRRPNHAYDHPESALFAAFASELLRAGNGVRFQARGGSMSPAIRDAEIVFIRPPVIPDLRCGDIVLIKSEMGFRLHRLVIADIHRDIFITRGDCGQQDDPAVSAEEILGIAVAKEVRVAGRAIQVKFRGMRAHLWCSLARAQNVWTRLNRLPKNSNL
jgi:hypothetical protein